jgi:hypothetical protein
LDEAHDDQAERRTANKYSNGTDREDIRRAITGRVASLNDLERPPSSFSRPAVW